MLQKPFSQACENNKQAILEVLNRYWDSPGKVLEIGSGTGQHAVFFAQNLPHISWQTSDLVDNHPGILAWMHDYQGENLRPPFELSVAKDDWQLSDFSGVFTANTAHIMSWDEVKCMIKGVATSLNEGGFWVIYGPFNYAGQFTSDSNERFNEWLQAQAPHRAIRDFEALCERAKAVGMSLLEDYSMPANNRCLVFQKQT